MLRTTARALTVVWLLALGSAVVAQQYEGYEWMPPGGRTLLSWALEDCADCPPIAELAAMERTLEEWASFWTEYDGALQALTEDQVVTLNSYLAANLPVEADEVGDLPRDGSLIAVENCTNCHAIAATMTQEWWTEPRWIDLLSGGTHGIIGLSDAEIATLAAYVVHNYVPMEEIPEPLRSPMPDY